MFKLSKTALGEIRTLSVSEPNFNIRTPEIGLPGPDTFTLCHPIIPSPGLSGNIHNSRKRKSLIWVDFPRFQSLVLPLSTRIFSLNIIFILFCMSSDSDIYFGGFRLTKEMPLKIKTKVFPKLRDNSPTPGGDILEDVVDPFTRHNLHTYLLYLIFKIVQTDVK
jgi:hypothetical protein